jgi:transposase-like protein
MSRNHDDCLSLLEKLRWAGKPTCPYCSSNKASAYKQERRYHCNHCFTSYSVTVGTIFHKTRMDLSKWFAAIVLLEETNYKVGVRELARKVGIDKNTAMSIIKRTESAPLEERSLLREIGRS